MAYEKKKPNVSNEPAYGGSPDYASLQQQIISLQAQIQTLCQAQAFEQVVISGVTMLSDATKALAEPIRAMAPKIRKMPEAAETKLRAIHLAVKRPDFGTWRAQPPQTPPRRTKPPHRRPTPQAGEYSA